jgi:hypothetical protein
MRNSRKVWALPVILLCFVPATIFAQLPHGPYFAPPLNSNTNTTISPLLPSEKSIRELVPEKYKKRYLEWKAEFLSTPTGRNEWAAYERNERFVLTIVVSDENVRGAGTSKYKWNDSGELVAATITLGGRLSEGYPNPIYYPVMNSLSPAKLSYQISGSILAATKIAHEFGHLNRMLKTNGATYLLRTELVPLYNRIFTGNGRNVRDPRLIDLARRMGGTPVEIWEDGEYWGEVNAMLFLRDKIAEQGYQCSLFNRIRMSVDTYARPYRERFAEVAVSTSDSSGWVWQ